MNTLGYLFILGGILLVRQVATGRVQNTPEDIRDLAIAFFSADIDGIKTVVSQRGTNVAATGIGGGEVAAVSGPVAAASQSSSAFAQKVISLGSAAKGYRLGATGPTYYDCSGLIWQAARQMGIFTGPRFTTHNFKSIAGRWAVQVEVPAAGDIVLWSGKHMGVALGGDKMYSARSTSKGIGESSISGDSGYFGTTATYWRINA